MKNIAWALIAAALIFTGTESFARGFSVGVFGAYSIDGGVIEDTIYLKTGNAQITAISYETVRIPGSGVFCAYEFSNNIFIRTGVEYNTLVSGNDIKDPASNSFHWDYETLSCPILCGISLSPDKGRTKIYGSAGPIISMIKIEYEQFEPSMNSTYKSDNETVLIGFAGLLGIEKKVIGNIYLMLEYAFYKCEEMKDQSGERSISLGPTTEYSYTERYGLPRQQVRLGVRYEF